MPMRSGSLSGDARWLRFGPRAGRLGVHSVLSLPLISADQVVGAMNVYAHARDAFDERSERLGQLYAVPAAIAVQNAQILAQTQRLAAKFQGGQSTTSFTVSLTFSPVCFALADTWSAWPSASRLSLLVSFPVASLTLPLASSAALLILSPSPIRISLLRGRATGPPKAAAPGVALNVRATCCQ